MDQSVSLMPHSVCWAAAPHLIWTMVITNFITFLSYLSICLTLLFLVRRTRRVIARDWYFFVVGFALFIVACGSTHLLEVITTWSPIFWVDAATNVITAILSALVAVMLIRRVTVIGFSLNDYSARLSRSEDEKRLMESSLLAAQKLEDWSRLSTVLAHEISQPLEAIQSLLFLIRTSGNVSPEIVGHCLRASGEADQILNISRSTLSFFRTSPQPEPTDLLQVVESVRYLLSQLRHKKSVEIVIRVEGDLVVRAVPGEVRQALFNLVRNACEASENSGSEVLVQLLGRPDHLEIDIVDQGSGIPPHVLDTLFQFGRSTKGEQGNGMGLWTVKHICDRHHATISVQSTPERGTRFHLRWPRSFVAPPVTVPSHAHQALSLT